MDDSNPLLGLAGGIAFLLLGLLAMLSPERIQQIVHKSYEGKRWRRHVPFLDFAESQAYVSRMRFMGWLFVGVSLFLILGSLMALLRR